MSVGDYSNDIFLEKDVPAACYGTVLLNNLFLLFGLIATSILSIIIVAYNVTVFAINVFPLSQGVVDEL